MRDIVDALGDVGVVPGSIHITDIGAMSAGHVEPWSRLVDRGRATLLGFEPQQEECSRCNASAGPGYVYLPEALGDGTTRTFHRCRCATNSSFYRPNIEVIGQYGGMLELMEVVETQQIATRRLDDIEEARQTDFLKLDVQGAELDILEHATETLMHVDIIQIEVCFVHLYQDQPLFADIDSFLRKQGFDFHTFLKFGSRRLSPAASDGNLPTGAKQVLWSDAIYLKSASLSSVDPDPAVLLKRAVLLFELFASKDFAARALRDYDRLTGHNVAEVISPLLYEARAA